MTHFDRRAELADRAWFTGNLGETTRTRPATLAERLRHRLPVAVVRRCGDYPLKLEFEETR